jgi:hypothetical protein
MIGKLACFTQLFSCSLSTGLLEETENIPLRGGEF